MCVVPEAKPFCSDWCASNEADEAGSCDCGHPICEQLYHRKVARA